MEAALRESEARFREMVDGLPLIVWVHDARGEQELVNETFCEFFGVTREEMKGGRWQLLMHPEDADAYRAEFFACVEAHRPFHHQVRVRRADGQWRWIESWARPRFSHEGTFRGYVGTSADVTDRIEFERLLRETDQRKDDFLAMLGHELRNPLAAIQSAAELLGLLPGEDHRLRHVQEVLLRQSRQVTSLVDGLLDVSRIARGMISLDRTIFDLGEILRPVLDDAARQASILRVTLQAALPDEPLWIHGDPVRVTQIFDNVLGNALKFTPPGGFVRVQAECDARGARVLVSDTGIGMRPESIARIFQPFAQESDGDTKEGSGQRLGLGLGLAVAQRLVELHNGHIEARSAGPGSGAEFEIRLPPSPAPEGRVSKPDTLPLPPRSVLLVEDDADAGLTLQKLLEADGHVVFLAGNGVDGLELARRHRPHLVLCDIGLPLMSGYELAQRVRGDASLRDLPLVALTGFGRTEDRVRALQAGFDEHLTKPIGVAALREALRRLTET